MEVRVVAVEVVDQIVEGAMELIGAGGSLEPDLSVPQDDKLDGQDRSGCRSRMRAR